MQSSNKSRERIMQEALDLQTQWERALLHITKGRQFDELSLTEQEEWNRISVIYNEQIDKKLAEWELS
jgi:hypothetical protein